jgi:hypothetical protein
MENKKWLFKTFIKDGRFINLIEYTMGINYFNEIPSLLPNEYTKDDYIEGSIENGFVVFNCNSKSEYIEHVKNLFEKIELVEIEVLISENSKFTTLMKDGEFVKLNEGPTFVKTDYPSIYNFNFNLDYVKKQMNDDLNLFKRDNNDVDKHKERESFNDNIISKYSKIDFVKIDFNILKP